MLTCYLGAVSESEFSEYTVFDKMRETLGFLLQKERQLKLWVTMVTLAEPEAAVRRIVSFPRSYRQYQSTHTVVFRMTPLETQLDISL